MKNTTLVFGVSLNPHRVSNMVIKRLLAYGENVLAFGRKEGMVDGVQVNTELILYPDVETVTLYLNPKNQQQYYDYLINLKPGRIIFNPGTENPEFYKLLEENKIDFEIACSLVLLSTNQY